MSSRVRRGGARKNRARPTPKWLLSSEQLDKVAQARCLLVLSVLSGEKPVSEAIAEAGISRGGYYQLETRALRAMLRALLPGASEEGEETSPVRQMAALEAKVKKLEQARRRSERLLAMTRKVMAGAAVKVGSPTRSTRTGRRPSRGSAAARREPRASQATTKPTMASSATSNGGASTP
jgi:hypothetical protein